MGLEWGWRFNGVPMIARTMETVPSNNLYGGGLPSWTRLSCLCQDSLKCE